MTLFKKTLLIVLVLGCVQPVMAQRDKSDSKAYSKVVVQNCYEDRVDVRVWVSDRGGAWRDRGAWKDHGLLESQGSDSGCPRTGTPKTIELRAGAKWVIKAIDSRCGSSTPVNTLPRCHILTTRELKGDASSADVYTVRIGTADQGISE